MACKIYLELNNGFKMPALGFGTWQATDAELEEAMENAMQAGYRHIDTAYVYENEAVIGRVLNRWISSGKVKREELFIVTKLPPAGNRPQDVDKYIQRSLKNLQLTYLDLYLIHTPFAFQDRNEENHPMDEQGCVMIDPTTDHVAVWKEMEKQVDAGRTKFIGISNFNIKQVERILANARIPPSNLQIEINLYLQQQELVDFCRSKNIIVTGYSPLGSKGLGALLSKLGVAKEIPDLTSNSVVLGIAKKHNVSSAQVLLRFAIQRGIAAIPKSTNATRIRENITIFHFSLDDDDMKTLKGQEKGPAARVCDFNFLKGIHNHPEFPF